MSYFSLHNHSEYSNIRLLDSINKTDKLIDKAIEYGLKGICLTDHEVLSGHVGFLEYYNKIKKNNPDFKIGLGNEIYLIDERKNKQKFYHFLLVAKNDLGHRALRELSSGAWYNSYFDRGMERVPTLYSELEAIVKKYPNTLIASTACLGGYLPSLVLELIKLEKYPEMTHLETAKLKQTIVDFLNFMTGLFGKDFYIEIAPGRSKSQIEYNKRVISIADAYDIKVIIATDSHFLTKNDRFIHKSYLNAQDGDREIDDFYEYCYLMTKEEILDILQDSFNDNNLVEKFLNNTIEIYDKIEGYKLFNSPVIPVEKVTQFPVYDIYYEYPSIHEMFISDDEQNRFWINTCVNRLNELNLLNNEYLSRLNIEADVILYISEKLQKSLSAYFNTLRSYINLFWECGSIVGPGRGSAVGFLSNFLLGITQLDPIKYDLPWFRFLNKERVELADIDIDLAPSKRPRIFKELRALKGELNVLQVATFGTEGTKSAILTACRGYRTEDFPEGIDTETAQYLTSLVPSHRGFLWPIKDVIYGNPEEDRKPIHDFIKEVNQYDGLLHIISSIEGST